MKTWIWLIIVGVAVVAAGYFAYCDMQKKKQIDEQAAKIKNLEAQKAAMLAAAGSGTTAAKMAEAAKITAESPIQPAKAAAQTTLN